jgi:hypothetical protein
MGLAGVPGKPGKIGLRMIQHFQTFQDCWATKARRECQECRARTRDSQFNWNPEMAFPLSIIVLLAVVLARRAVNRRPLPTPNRLCRRRHPMPKVRWHRPSTVMANRRPNFHPTRMRKPRSGVEEGKSENGHANWKIYVNLIKNRKCQEKCQLQENTLQISFINEFKKKA